MITTHQLTRTFLTGRGREKSTVTAVAGVDLHVEQGEIVGFLGPNGAGKTTTLKVLTTLLKPTSGSAVVAGHDVSTDAVKVRQEIGYVSQSGSVSGEARAGDEIVDHASLYGIPRTRAVARGRELFEELDLEGMWTRQAKSMSGGQRRRLDIAMGLVHEPRLLFLDEPTTGLDPQARANMWSHISDLRGRLGSTVFLTTHYLDEADALCDRIFVIDHGRIVASDTPDQLKRAVRGDLLELTVASAADAATAAAQLGRLPDVMELVRSDLVVSARVPSGGTALPGLLRELDAAGVTLTAVDVQRPTLDDVFLTLTGRSLRENEAA